MRSIPSYIFYALVVFSNAGLCVEGGIFSWLSFFGRKSPPQLRTTAISFDEATYNATERIQQLEIEVKELKHQLLFAKVARNQWSKEKFRLQTDLNDISDRTRDQLQSEFDSMFDEYKVKVLLEKEEEINELTAQFAVEKAEAIETLQDQFNEERAALQKELSESNLSASDTARAIQDLKAQLKAANVAAVNNKDLAAQREEVFLYFIFINAYIIS